MPLTLSNIFDTSLEIRLRFVLLEWQQIFILLRAANQNNYSDNLFETLCAFSRVLRNFLGFLQRIFAACLIMSDLNNWLIWLAKHCFNWTIYNFTIST
jgi:hypothetical protein